MATFLNDSSCNMYAAKPYFPPSLGIEIPNIMYAMKNIQTGKYDVSFHIH